MRTFDALRSPHFRLLWIGQLLSGLGMAMQMLAVGWLVILLAEHDGRPELGPFYLGLVGLGRAIPSLAFGLIGGVIADRWDRRTLMWCARAVAAANATILAAFTLTGNASLPLLMIIAVADSLANAVNQPAGQVMITRLVPAGTLMGAVSLNQATGQTTFLLGPLVGGILIVPFGVGGVMAANAAIYLVALGFLLGLPSSRPEGPAREESIFASLVDGLRYVANDPVLRWVLGVSALASLFVRPGEGMLPAVAHDSLHVGAVELSWLLAAQALGFLAGTIVAGQIGGMRRRGLLVVLGVIGWSVFLAAFALQTAVVPAIVMMVLTGLPHFVFSGTMIVLAQTRPPDRYRGRVVSLMMLTISGIMPIGILGMGTLATIVGIGHAIAGGALLFAAFGVYLFMFVDPIRRLGDDAPLPVRYSPAK